MTNHLTPNQPARNLTRKRFAFAPGKNLVAGRLVVDFLASLAAYGPRTAGPLVGLE